MEEELQAMESNNTWEVVPLPKGKHFIGYRWVYRIKHKQDRSIDRFIAHLVAKGYTQQVGIDFQDTFSPVVKLTTMRVLLVLATIKGFPTISICKRGFWSIWFYKIDFDQNLVDINVIYI